MGSTSKRYDHEEMIRLRDAGMEMKDIAEKMGCTVSCVKSVMAKAGKTSRKVETESLKVPITKEEIERFRGMLKIGSEICLEKKDSVDEHTMRRVKYTVVAKYRHFFIARSQRGEEKSILYTEQIIRDGRPTA